MAKAKREQRERTDNWKQIQQWCRWPEQQLYESIRPVVLYGETPTERAVETSLPERTLRRHADAFDEQGMVVFLRPTLKQQHDMHRSLPVPMRQLIVDFKAEHPVYVILVMDNFSRAILASDIYQSQDLASVLLVLYAAIEQLGGPHRLVTDNGSVFRMHLLHFK